MKLYKFKSGTEKDISALLADKLWVSTLVLMNDPTDLGFYIGPDYTDKDIIAFQDALNLSVVVASFANIIQNRRLWNYYSNGMRGLVLTYRLEDLIDAFARFGDKYGTRIFKGKVSYGEEKYDLTTEFEKYVKSGITPNLGKDLGLLFHKDESWKDEKEYRIALYLGQDNKEKGFLLNKIRPYEVGVGYRIAPNDYETIKGWCVDKKVTLRKYTPDFKDIKSNSPFKAELIVRGGVERTFPVLDHDFDDAEIDRDGFMKLLMDAEENTPDVMEEIEEQKNPEEGKRSEEEWMKSFEELYKEYIETSKNSAIISATGGRVSDGDDERSLNYKKETGN